MFKLNDRGRKFSGKKGPRGKSTCHDQSTKKKRGGVRGNWLNPHRWGNGIGNTRGLINTRGEGNEDVKAAEDQRE